MRQLQNLRNDPGFAAKVEMTEAASWVDLTSQDGHPREIRHERIDDTIVIVDESPGGSINRVLLLGLEHPARPETIDKIIGIYQEAHVKSFRVHLSPVARPTSISRMLTQRNFERTLQEAVIARSTDNVPAPDPYFRFRTATIEDTDVVIEIAQRSGNVESHWARMIAKPLTRDNWRLYLAYDGSTPYSVGGLHINGDVAWLAPAWTLPEYRNRGTQAALVAHSLRAAREIGCQWATTYYIATSGVRPRNFERLGFELVYMRPRYVWKLPETVDK